MTAALLDSGPDLPIGAVPPLFALLVTVAGHADTESETADTAAALLSRLAEVAGRSESALLSELGPPLLQRLAEDAELWTAASSDLLTLLALLRCSGESAVIGGGERGYGVVRGYRLQCRCLLM